MSIETVGGVDVTPKLMAELFWEMNSEEQADFFAALDSIAGYRLCIQMGGVVREISERATRGDHQAQNGFQTMLAHAQEYSQSATDIRAFDATRANAKAAEAAKKGLGLCAS
ncbi:hypothetical protein [Stenotrophomonas maltophilia]|uniref:Uncharacterized protein n=1 Tax=Stenotrophomonas maltophilia TaxID=40324 RepID=A0A4S2D4G8_STEMA|nr:hypothetical protein [Stenotrophomonas maltophilia]TGY35224.1 hypothetical protein E5352_05755 [Stenotrophomonas maltophilia]